MVLWNYLSNKKVLINTFVSTKNHHPLYIGDILGRCRAKGASIYQSIHILQFIFVFLFHFEAPRMILFCLDATDYNCLICSLIKMGISMAYSDNTCPTCGLSCV